MPESTRDTVHLDPPLYRALRLKAAETDRSVSDLVNEAVRTLLAEDADDLAAIEERAGEPAVSFSAFVRRLRAEGAL